VSTQIGQAAAWGAKPYTWAVDCITPSGQETYVVYAHILEVTDGGVLQFWNDDGTIIRAVSPSGWTAVTQR
jgi:hypothetical protein